MIQEASGYGEKLDGFGMVPRAGSRKESQNDLCMG